MGYLTVKAYSKSEQYFLRLTRSTKQIINIFSFIVISIKYKLDIFYKTE